MQNIFEFEYIIMYCASINENQSISLIEKFDLQEIFISVVDPK